MQLASSAFQNGKPIPTKYANVGVKGGQNISIPLEWRDVPPATKCLALSIIDPHPVANNWVHWLVINIPKNITTLSEGVSTKNMPSGSKEFYNSFGTIGYGGPQPPKGSGLHPYEITLYALNVEKLDLGANTSLSAFKNTLEGKVLGMAKIVGTYER
ncbi:MAG TPA: YbhB/YbcL family Raf kinase inhibitor-like protein [Bacteroidota bacterium]|nr:YbhB/YbcL family Raf kinase inhibitor-like protein [Bacteroidota bacterium]